MKKSGMPPLHVCPHLVTGLPLDLNWSCDYQICQSSKKKASDRQTHRQTEASECVVICHLQWLYNLRQRSPLVITFREMITIQFKLIAGYNIIVNDHHLVLFLFFSWEIRKMILRYHLVLFFSWEIQKMISR